MSCRSISLVICMSVTVSLATLYRDPDWTEDWSTKESVVGQGVTDQLAWLLDARDHAVVTLQAGDTRLVAHRIVLLAGGSSVFTEILKDFVTHDSGGRLVVRGVEGPVLRYVLAYLYTRRAPRLSRGMTTQLLAAAHRFNLPYLQRDCERQLAAQLTIENAADAAVLAVNLSADHLRDAAVNFIKDHRIKVLATEGWAYALQHHPKEAAEVTHLLADRLAGICGPATMEAEKTTMKAEDSTVQAETTVTAQPSPAPVTSAPALASCPTSPLDEDAVSRLRNLSKLERDDMLIQAAKAGAVGDLRELLAAGADVGTREGPHGTSLHFAAMKGHVEAASCLLAAGAKVGSKGRRLWTPLHEAAFWDQAAMVRLLVAASADPNARDEYGTTPLHVAAWYGKPEAAVALLEVGADRDAENDAGNTPLDDARDKEQQQLIEILTRG